MATQRDWDDLANCYGEWATNASDIALANALANVLAPRGSGEWTADMLRVQRLSTAIFVHEVRARYAIDLRGSDDV